MTNTTYIPSTEPSMTDMVTLYRVEVQYAPGTSWLAAESVYADSEAAARAAAQASHPGLAVWVDRAPDYLQPIPKGA